MVEPDDTLTKLERVIWYVLMVIGAASLVFGSYSLIAWSLGWKMP